MTHYDTLGLKPDASPEDIKRAFRRAASAAHPDRDGGSTEGMQAVNKAFDVLGDPARRERYDRTGLDDRTDIEKQAHDLLVQTFDRALKGDVDPVRAAAKHLAVLRENIAQSRAGIEAEQVRLKRRSGKTKVKKGDNLVQMLIDRKLLELDRQHAQACEAMEIHAKAVAMLDSYEGEPEAPAPAQVYSSGIDAMLYAMQAAQQTNPNGGWKRG